MANNKIKSLFYESPAKKPEIAPVVEKAIVQPTPQLKSKISSIIREGVLFGSGPKLYGTGQAQLGQALGGGGGYAGAITTHKAPGETQFGVIEEEDDEMGLDDIASEIDDSATPTDKASTEETPSEEAPAEGEDAPKEDAPEEAPKDETPPEPEAPPEPQQTPEQKVTEMFADTGDVDKDYSLTNENNIRLEKFKFVNAGIDLNTLIPEDDKKSGISTKDVANLLTPSQRDLLKDSNRELRKKYPLIDKREKYIILHNSNIPIFNTNMGDTHELSKEMKKQAYDKINAYMETNFGKNWQDKSKAIEFLRTIKINFANNPAIRANLINLASMIAEEGENYKIPLDKVNVMVPALVQEFIKTNKEDPVFARSNIFRTITSAYNQEAGTKGQVYVILNSENLGDGQEEGGDESTPEEGDMSSETPKENAPPEEEAGGEGENDMAAALEDEVPPLPVG
jgi:hypothetical protein